MLPSEFLLLAVIIVSTLTITKLTITAVTALEKHLSLRRKLIEEYSELSEWLDAYELCIDWHLNQYPPELKDSSELIRPNDPLLNSKLKLLIEEHILPWVKEGRLYMEGYYHTIRARNRIIELLEE